MIAIVVLPRQRQDIARGLLADVLEHSADMAHATWLEPLDPPRCGASLLRSMTPWTNSEVSMLESRSGPPVLRARSGR